MKAVEANCHVKDGILIIRNKSAFLEHIKSFEGKELEMVVRPKKRYRSANQNRFYWNVPVALIRDRFIELGSECSLEDVHLFLKNRFNYKELVDESSGEILHIPDTTTQLTTTEFMEYLLKIQEFGATVLGIQIPNPGEQLTINQNE